MDVNDRMWKRNLAQPREEEFLHVPTAPSMATRSQPQTNELRCRL